MSFYDNFNAAIEYIEQHLDDGISQTELASVSGVNYVILQRVFPLLANITLSEYIRNRRLTLAGRDLVQTDFRIIDIAMKYGYDSAAAFSRAFQKFHHLHPSEVKKQASQLQHFAKLQLTPPVSPRTVNYEVIEMPSLVLYGLEVISDNQHIKQDAPKLFEHVSRCFPELSHPDYGLLDYELGRDDNRRYRYYVLWQEKYHDNFLTKHIAAGRWLKFHIDSQEANAIQVATDQFYADFLPTCPYQLRPDPELEHYYAQGTDLLIPIY